MRRPRRSWAGCGQSDDPRLRAHRTLWERVRWIELQQSRGVAPGLVASEHFPEPATLVGLARWLVVGLVIPAIELSQEMDPRQLPRRAGGGSGPPRLQLTSELRFSDGAFGGGAREMRLDPARESIQELGRELQQLRDGLVEILRVRLHVVVLELVAEPL
jgi:hypothetical protein